MAKCETCNNEGRVKCPECEGRPLEMDCPECEGSGLVEREMVDEDGEYTGRLEECDCEACDGRGICADGAMTPGLSAVETAWGRTM